MSGFLIAYETPHRSATENVPVTIDRYPDTCPLCGRSITANPLLYFAQNTGAWDLRGVFYCPAAECQEVFIAYYSISAPRSKSYVYRRSVPAIPRHKKFSDEIAALSSTFVELYNEALAAEQYGLGGIAGPGFRKALEFLVKDYAISQNPEAEDQIQVSFLGQCIKSYIADERIRVCAEKAVWLGNDETHYVRKFTSHDINDMKTLIRLTVNWVESDILTAHYRNDITR